MGRQVCNLETANDLQDAVEPYLDEWARQAPDGAALVFKRGGDVEVRLTKSYAKALTAQNRLHHTERMGSIIVAFSDHVLML